MDFDASKNSDLAAISKFIWWAMIEHFRASLHFLLSSYSYISIMDKYF